MAGQLPDRTSETMILQMRRAGELKAGDNPGLEAELWRRTEYDPSGNPIRWGVSVTDFPDLGCKARKMSVTNVLDARAVLTTCVGLRERYEGEHVVVNSKHTRPVIAAKGRTQLEATLKALAGDVNSPFGGVWMFSHPMEYPTAVFMNKIFAEGYLAPDYELGAAEHLADTNKKNNKGNLDSHKNRFIWKTGPLTHSDIRTINSQGRGADVITQDFERPFNALEDCFIACGNGPVTGSVGQLGDEVVSAIDFGGNVAPYLNSNLVFFLVGDAIAGLGDGCGSRVVAAAKARYMLENSVYAAMAEGDDLKWRRVLYDTPFTREDFEGVISPDFKLVAFSDAFYPKPDGWIESTGLDRTNNAFNSGMIMCPGKKGEDEEIILKRNNQDSGYNPALVAKCVVQPGGSNGDHYVLNLSDRFGVPLVLTIPLADMEKYDMEKARAGKNPGAKGRRFFGHQTE